MPVPRLCLVRPTGLACFAPQRFSINVHSDDSGSRSKPPGLAGCHGVVGLGRRIRWRVPNNPSADDYVNA